MQYHVKGRILSNLSHIYSYLYAVPSVTDTFLPYLFVNEGEYGELQIMLAKGRWDLTNEGEYGELRIMLARGRWDLTRCLKG